MLSVGLAAVVTGCGATATTSAAGSNVTAALGTARAMPPAYFGTNYDYGASSIYVKDHDVDGQLAALAPGTLRWPAGTGANYFQWRKGYPVPVSAPAKGSCGGAGEGEQNGFTFTLADLASAYRRTGAPPMFDLDVMTDTIGDQIEMLRTARDTDRMPITYVELGNEFYLCNADYVRAFPTGQDYGRAVAVDVQALHQAFPGVKVAAVGSVGSSTARGRGWNAGLLSVATGAGRPDAITLHDHPRYDGSLAADGLPELFTEPYTSTARVRTATGTLDGVPAWITEYGLSMHWTKGNPAQRTYANALFESESAMLLAQHVDGADLLDYWAAFGSGVNYDYSGADPTRLTPVGLAMTWLDDAARGATTMAPITFAGGPTLGTGHDSAVVGESFSGRAAHREMLVDLGGRPVTLPGGAAVPSGARYQQATGNPVQQVPAASSLHIARGTIGSHLVLAPYSMTEVGA